MRVKVDFDAKYAAEADPWSIGDAATPRYDLYRDRLLALAGDRSAVLDVGSGFGAFLARLETAFDELHAVEIAAVAITEGRRRHPGITFMPGSAAALGETPADRRRFGAIVCSDVLYYLRPHERRACLEWIAGHLAPDGIALVAAYCPGGRYLTASELRRLVDERFVVLEAHHLESGHVAFLVRPRRVKVALTVDHETWQPIPEGRSIDFEADVFAPTRALLDACDRQGARLTLFAEVGEYLWLREHDVRTADRFAEQWRDAVTRGHDVQLHLHPSWLPELGARRDGDGWWWDATRARAADYPGDLTELIGRCRRALEDAIRPVAPGYAVTCFRAGTYEIQPFPRLHDALAANGIACDSSVYAGGRREGRSYDFRLAYAEHQPYFASRQDPQLKAPPSERSIVELPLFSPAPNERWTFDFAEGARFAQPLLDRLDRRPAPPERARRTAKAHEAAGLLYRALRPARRVVNPLLPRAAQDLVAPPYPPERTVADDCFVLVGHCKADLDVAGIERELERLAPRVTFATMAELAADARAELTDAVSSDPEQEAVRQVAREYGAVMSDERNHEQSARLLSLVPRDRSRVLDLGCGAGTWSAALSERLPWARITGVDAGPDFITRAAERHGSEAVDFLVGDFTALPFADGTFDAIYADNSLEHAYDVTRTLAEVHRVLADEGVLVAAIPSDARNPARICDNHTWKTAPHDVLARLADAGFSHVRITEVDTFRRLGTTPYPPGANRMMYLRAWKGAGPARAADRAAQVSRFVYERLRPDAPYLGTDLAEVLAGGQAWCTGYAVATGLLLREEGFPVRWATLIGDGPPLTGDAPVDAHEVLEVGFPDGSWRVLDPMADVWFDDDLRTLLGDPGRADVELPRDARFRERGYAAYTGSDWYGRVTAVAVRTDPAHPQFFDAAERYRAGRTRPRGAARRFVRRARQRLDAAGGSSPLRRDRGAAT